MIYAIVISLVSIFGHFSDTDTNTAAAVVTLSPISIAAAAVGHYCDAGKDNCKPANTEF